MYGKQIARWSVSKAFTVCFAVGGVEGEDEDSFHSWMVVLIRPNQVSVDEFWPARVASFAARGDKILIS